MDRALLSILVVNRFGVLTKVTGLFGRRGYNIKALSVGETENPDISRITVTTEGDAAMLEQICSQVLKLEEVFAAEILPLAEAVERELVLIKVKPGAENVGRLMQIVSDFSAKSTGTGDSVVIEASGRVETVDRLVALLGGLGIVELCRTGATALGAGGEPLRGKSP